MNKHLLLTQDKLGGKDLHAMFAIASKLLKDNLDHINAINVFPVADGDTGTNILMTIMAAITESQKAQKSNSAALVASALAHGALLGAKGNSGVILSQFFKGIAQALTGKPYINTSDFALALEEARKLAYLATDKPIEGTILTVLRRIAASTKTCIKHPCSLAQFCENICKTASEAVADTPNLLPELKQAGVVDAGGQALLIILEGIRFYITGKKPKLVFPKHAIQPAAPTTTHNEKNTFGCCTNFSIADTDQDLIKNQIAKDADSIVIVGDNKLLKIHLHTPDPVNLLNSVSSLGKLVQVQIDNMDEQHKAYQVKSVSDKPVSTQLVIIIPEISFANVFISLGMNVVLLNEQSDQSVFYFLQQLASNNLLALNINPANVFCNEKMRVSTQGNITIINLSNIAEAIAATMAVDYGEALIGNINNIKKACLSIKTGEITRQDTFFVGHLLTQPLTRNTSLLAVMIELLAQSNLKANQLLTLYYGNNLTERDGADIEEYIHKTLPRLELETVRTNHKSSYLFFSIE